MSDSITRKRQLSLDGPSDDESIRKRRTNDVDVDSEGTERTTDQVSHTQCTEVQTTTSNELIVGDMESLKEGVDSNEKDLEIMESNEIFAETDEDFEFSHTKIIMQRHGQLFFASTKARIQKKEKIDTSKLEISPIPQEHVYPILPTQAPSSISVDIFIKRPSMISYADSKSLTEISSLFMHEAQMCERIKKSPHPNIAKYFGCHVDEGGLITGLCFKKYSKTLHQMVMAGEAFERSECLGNIKAGIEHLHSLGIIHCDINPHNIFLDQSTFVIGDFDSCTLEGDELGMKAGTDGWTDDDFELAQRENDWFGFRKIKEFVFSTKKGRK